MNNNNVHRKKEKQRYNFKFLGLTILFVFALCCVIIFLSIDGRFKPQSNMNHIYSNEIKSNEEVSFQQTLQKFAKKNDLQLNEWKKDYIERAEQNPELEEFVLNYPLKKDKHPKIKLNDLRDCDSVPLLMQWDERWGYEEYAGNLMGFTGCGPTCLSMVSIYLLNDTKYNPKYVAEFSIDYGYSIDGSGSAWALISEGGKKLGLDVKEIPLDEKRIIRNLEAGNPIICVMGPGDFTKKGHFIVMTDYVDGKIKVNDPNSKIRSETLWDYQQIKGQIKNLWVCRSAK